MAETVEHMHSMMTQAIAARTPPVPTETLFAPAAAIVPPPLAAPQTSSASGQAVLSKPSSAISVDLSAIQENSATCQPQRQCRKDLAASSPAASDADGKRAGSLSRSDLLRMIQRAAEDAIKSNLRNTGRCAGCSSGAADISSDIGHSTTQLVVDTFVQSKDVPSMAAIEDAQDAAKRNLARARNATLSPPNKSSSQETSMQGARAVSFQRSFSQPPDGWPAMGPDDDNDMKI